MTNLNIGVLINDHLYPVTRAVINSFPQLLFLGVTEGNYEETNRTEFLS